MIKKLIHILTFTSAAVIVCSFPSARLNAQTTLSEGQSYTFQFSSMDFVGLSGAQPNQSGFGLLLDGADPTWSEGANWRVDLFDPFISEGTPFFSGQHALGAGIVAPNAWGNLQGSGTITMLTGNLTLDAVNVWRINADASKYSTTIGVIPEPSTYGLLMAGTFLGYCVFAQKRKN